MSTMVVCVNGFCVVWLQDFHVLARQCSRPVGGTLHFMNSTNWTRDVKGASHIDVLLRKLAALERGDEMAVMGVDEVNMGL